MSADNRVKRDLLSVKRDLLTFQPWLTNWWARTIILMSFSRQNFAVTSGPNSTQFPPRGLHIHACARTHTGLGLRAQGWRRMSRPHKCQKRPTKCQKRPTKCQKRPTTGVFVTRCTHIFTMKCELMELQSRRRIHVCHMRRRIHVCVIWGVGYMWARGVAINVMSARSRAPKSPHTVGLFCTHEPHIVGLFCMSAQKPAYSRSLLHTWTCLLDRSWRGPKAPSSTRDPCVINSIYDDEPSAYSCS
jgi:hypothetical protein